MAKSLPPVPKFKQIIGPSFILLGLALGSGELILWPYLTARWGLGLLWGAVLGITLQFFLNSEIMRYTLCWGESIFVGFWKLWRWWPLWFIISTFIPWSLPGFSSGTAAILREALGRGNPLFLAIALLVLGGIIITLGKTLYRTMELFQRTIILVGLPLILFLVLVLVSPNDGLALAQGLVGRGQLPSGEKWWFFPAGISLVSFLAAVAYSGAGGNLNLVQSYYIKEKGFGMGKFAGKITSLFSGGRGKKYRLVGEIFVANPINRRRFRRWWRLVIGEHWLIFWFLGLTTIILLSLLSYLLVFGRAETTGIAFLYQEGRITSARLGRFLGKGFLLVAAGMLYSTQIGILESTSRIISENFLLLRHKKEKEVNAGLFFYLALWLQIAWGIFILLLGFSEPRFLLTLGAVMNAFAMVVVFPLVWYLNRRSLPDFARPKKVRQLFYWFGFAFLLFFSLMMIGNQ